MASDATTAQRLLNSSSSSTAAKAAPRPNNSVPLLPPPPVAAQRPPLPGYTSRPRIPLPSRLKTGKPKHWINVRNLPKEHPSELFPAAPGYAQPLA